MRPPKEHGTILVAARPKHVGVTVALAREGCIVLLEHYRLTVKVVRHQQGLPPRWSSFRLRAGCPRRPQLGGTRARRAYRVLAVRWFCRARH